MAFHSIGQVGYMVLGLGLGLYFLPLNPALGTIALVGGLFSYDQPLLVQILPVPERGLHFVPNRNPRPEPSRGALSSPALVRDLRHVAIMMVGANSIALGSACNAPAMPKTSLSRL
jgi:hypothetical protein